MSITSKDRGPWFRDGDGSSVSFTYAAVIYAKTDLKVYIDGALKTLTTDYDVTNVGVSGGGNVVFVVAPAAGTGNIAIVPATPETIEINLTVGGNLPSATIGAKFDLVMAIAQQHRSMLDRAIKVALTENISLADLPAAANRASKYLAFDAAGQPIASSGPTGNSSIPVSAFVETLLDDTDAATARATLGLGGQATIASASETALGSSTTLYNFISGTVSINAFSAAPAGTLRITEFQGVLTLVNSAALILLGGVNKITAAGDMAIWISDAPSGIWRCVHYGPASGKGLGIGPNALVSFTRDLTTASGSQAVTGVGFKPSAILFRAVVSGTTYWSYGMVDQNGNPSLMMQANAAGATNMVPSVSYCTGIDQTDGAAFNLASVSSFNADGFTLAWTKSGSPTGIASLSALCFK